MTDYRIEAATKEEWAERALRAEVKLAKAVGTLEFYAYGGVTPRHRLRAQKILAEIKGEGHE